MYNYHVFSACIWTNFFLFLFGNSYMEVGSLSSWKSLLSANGRLWKKTDEKQARTQCMKLFLFLLFCLYPFYHNYWDFLPCEVVLIQNTTWKQESRIVVSASFLFSSLFPIIFLGLPFRTANWWCHELVIPIDIGFNIINSRRAPLSKLNYFR